MLDSKGNLMNYEQFCMTHDFSPPFTEFYGLRKTAREYLNLKHFENVDVVLPNLPQPIALFLVLSRPGIFIYNFLSKQLYEKPKFEKKWESVLNIPLSDDWWRKAHSCAVNFTNDSKLKLFQIRLTHRILSTNTFLFKIGLSTSQLCSFCKDEPEETIHLYWSCKLVQSFWSSLFYLINQSSDFIVNYNRENILFGKFEGPKLINLIISLGKYHIYRRRLVKCLPCLEYFKIELLHYYKIEKYIFRTKCQLQDFNNRWTHMAYLFQE